MVGRQRLSHALRCFKGGCPGKPEKSDSGMTKSSSVGVYGPLAYGSPLSFKICAFSTGFSYVGSCQWNHGKHCFLSATLVNFGYAEGKDLGSGAHWSGDLRQVISLF